MEIPPRDQGRLSASPSKAGPTTQKIMRPKQPQFADVANVAPTTKNNAPQATAICGCGEPVCSIPLYSRQCIEITFERAFIVQIYKRQKSDGSGGGSLPSESVSKQGDQGLCEVEEGHQRYAQPHAHVAADVAEHLHPLRNISLC
ncbi:hypothetical protein CEXT_78201 [Caerostris extrusa]|uniref:Uncharacterized protein n=1 Tax=Caerostris extrusa TaxID=172846 RepID=A0AAV4RYS0_CAEEX|nr:hypothetical protein CEXT_78201 [Caerostris extrusa]